MSDIRSRIVCPSARTPRKLLPMKLLPWHFTVIIRILHRCASLKKHLYSVEMSSVRCCTQAEIGSSPQVVASDTCCSPPTDPRSFFLSWWTVRTTSPTPPLTLSNSASAVSVYPPIAAKISAVAPSFCACCRICTEFRSARTCRVVVVCVVPVETRKTNFQRTDST